MLEAARLGAMRNSEVDLLHWHRHLHSALGGHGFAAIRKDMRLSGSDKFEARDSEAKKGVWLPPKIKKAGWHRLTGPQLHMTRASHRKNLSEGRNEQDCHHDDDSTEEAR